MAEHSTPRNTAAGNTAPGDTTPEPVAIVGLGCRFAGGADSPALFWDLLAEGRDGIGDLPEGRWDDYRDRGPDHARALRRATARGGFLADVAGFDPAFFGLSPREAELMDPQQRLLLELTWEALEDAGIPPDSLAGGDTGVFVGIGSDDYGRRMLEDLPTIEAWTGIGAALCASANRVSHALDLRGPSLAVDTACSASLVAAHLACQALRARECGLAVVGGVNLVLAPGLTLTLDAAGATAPDGRCKPFDAEADGYGRGEGGGVLVLKLLADARRDGDPVVAVIRGSAVSQDGRTNGIMAPNGQAQRDLVALTCARAGVDPVTVDYVEAHGTGTRLGDPLEAGALGAVYGTGRPGDRPCLIGSVKGSIGHLEAGAGVASLIKAALAVRHGEIPASLGFSSPNPAIDWAGSGLRVSTAHQPWPSSDGPRRAGVSGFGYGGTIGHVLLEQAPDDLGGPAGERGGATVFPLSAHTPSALRDRAGALADLLAGARAPDAADVAHTLALRRTHLAHRAAVVAADRDELVAGLRSVADGQPGPALRTGEASADRAAPVWVFSGHGSQWAGMGRELLATDPAFAAAIEELEPVFLEEIGFSPARVLLEADFSTVDRVQTMIFAVQVGLAASWRAAGVRPAAVMGHSVGEVAAAVAAGVLSPADGARLICRRSVLLRRVAGAGAMTMVDLPFAEAEARLAGRADVVTAIWAAPSSTVISGTPEGVEDLGGRWRAEGLDVRRVSSDVAFHSPQMDGLLDDLRAAVSDLRFHPQTVPVYSTALVDPRAPRIDADYWAANLREPVRLAPAVAAAAEDGHRLFIEVSAHPVLLHSVRETLADADLARESVVVPTLRRDTPQRAAFLDAVAAVHCAGGEVDWSALTGGGRLTALPALPWQRTPHWHRFSTPAGADGGHDVDSHTLLGQLVPVSGRGARLWRTALDDASRPYPGSHSVHGTEIVPAAVLITSLVAAADGGDLADVVLRLPLTTAEHREVQLVRDGAALHLASRLPADDEWAVHTTATARAAVPTGPVAPAALVRADPARVREHLTAVGVPDMAFDWTVNALALGEWAVDATITPDPATPGWAALLDAALSVAPLAHPGEPELRVVSGVDSVALRGGAPATAAVRVRRSTAPDAVDVLVGESDGPHAVLVGLRYAGVGTGRARAEELVHEVVWRELPAPEAPARPVVLVADEPDGRIATLADALSAAGAEVGVRPVSALTSVGPGTDVVVPAFGDADAPASAARAADLYVRAAQALVGRADSPRLWAATTGVRDADGVDGLTGAPLWGIGRVLATEHEELHGGVVDLPAGPDESAAGLLAALRTGPGAEVLSVRGGVVSASRLARVRPGGGDVLRCRQEGTYLITGGLGVLGLAVARRLAERGARRLVLVGRRGVPARAAWGDPAHADDPRIAAITGLEARGVTVKVVAVDIADAAAARAALDPAALDLPPVTGVVHAAGVLDNRLLRGVDGESLRSVLRPKADGAWVLHGLYPPGSLDFLVLFSSCGHLLGMPGQVAYGAANAFLDALAAHRPDTTSLAWTSWRGLGMAANAVVDRELAARGVTGISPDEAFAAWDLAAKTGPGRYPVLRVVPGATTALPVLAGIAASPAQPDPTPAADLAALSGDELHAHLVSEVTEQIAGEMRLPAAALDAHRSLSLQGLDSVMTIVVRKRLERAFARPIPPTLLWHQPTVVAIADHLVAVLGDPGARRAV
ncbi:acyltransferase domain-containing protein [Actinokineospora sp. PR83]|uniref:type I polyketide synthase n=1 Tax=Actinokineospora sp. PR83 TaxID=2884908 RepID=UPI001F390383|nr:type I polyketide synthase [Actinokineospora sp. PR83]MCG8914456.1 acyltransferase domain-containing protein [Actinokineospora sp. PR83]